MNTFVNPIVLGTITGISIGVLGVLITTKRESDYRTKFRKAIPYLRFIAPDKVDKELEREGIELNKDTKCSVCNRGITSKNFGAVRKKGKEIIFVCSRKHCMNLGKIVSIE